MIFPRKDIIDPAVIEKPGLRVSSFAWTSPEYQENSGIKGDRSCYSADGTELEEWWTRSPVGGH